MPIRESICLNPECELLNKPVEHYYHRQDSAPSDCAACGGKTELVFSRFGIVWTGDITARYLDRDKSREAAPRTGAEGGHYVYERVNGKSVPRWISTWQEQREHCKRNGLAVPSEVGRNLNVGEDGKTVASPMGLPGVEV